MVRVQVAGGLSLEERRLGIVILVLTSGLSSSCSRLDPWFLTRFLNATKFFIKRTLLNTGY